MRSFRAAFAALLALAAATTGSASRTPHSQPDCRAQPVPARAGTFRIGGHGNLLAFGDEALWTLTEPPRPKGAGDAPTRVELRRVDLRKRIVERVGALRARGDARFLVSQGAAWISDPESGTVTRLRLSDRKTTTIRPFGRDGQPTELVVAGNRVWVISSSRGQVAALDPTTLSVTARLRIAGVELADLVLGFGSLWVSVPDERAVVRVDLRRGRVSGRVVVPGAVGDLAPAGPSLWVDLPDRDTVAPIDPRRLTVSGPERAYDSDAFALVGGFDSLWLTNYGVAKVTRFDARTGRQLRIYPVGRDPKGIVTGAGSVWTMNAGGCSITRIDP